MGVYHRHSSGEVVKNIKVLQLSSDMVVKALDLGDIGYGFELHVNQKHLTFKFASNNNG